MARLRASARATVRELLGLLTAAGLGAVAVAVLLRSDRASVLLFGADSTVVPLVQRGFDRGEPFGWRMTSTVFAVEIPIHRLVAVVAEDPITRVVINAVGNYVLLYLALRAVAAVVGSAAGPNRRVLAALAAVAVPTLAVGLENTTSTSSAEFASMAATTAYYYPLLVAMMLTAALAGAAAARARAGYRSGLAGPAIGFAAVTVVLTASNPLFVGWGVLPIVLAAAVVAYRGQIGAAVPAVLAVAAAVGTGAAMVIRSGLGEMVGQSSGARIGLPLTGIGPLVANVLVGSAADVSGMARLIGLVGLTAVTVFVARRESARTGAPERAVVAVAAAMIVAVVVAGAWLLGAAEARYLQPILFAPLLSLVVLATDPQTLTYRTPDRARRWTAAALAAIAAGAGAVATTDLVATTAAARYAPAQCLADWLGDQDRVGAGGFWTIRSLAAFGPDRIRLVQTEDHIAPGTWMTNRHDFRPGRRIDYVLAETTAGDPAHAGEPSDQQQAYRRVLGEPAAVISCADDGYTILDYRGTAGQQILTDRLTDSGAD